MKMLDEKKMRTQPGQAVNEKEAEAASNPYAKFEKGVEMDDVVDKLAKKKMQEIIDQVFKKDNEEQGYMPKKGR